MANDMDANLTSYSGTLRANDVTITYRYESTDTEWRLYLTNVSITGDFDSVQPRDGRHTLSFKVNHTYLAKYSTVKIPSAARLEKLQGNKNKDDTSSATWKNGNFASIEQERQFNAEVDRIVPLFLNDLNTAKNTNGGLIFSRVRKTTTYKFPIVLNAFGTKETASFEIPAIVDQSQTEHEEKQTVGIESVNDGKNYVTNAKAFGKYGLIERVVDFSDVKNEKQLLNLARTYVRAMQFDEMVINLSAVDLYNLNGDIRGFEFLDNVRCVSSVHNLDTYLPITEMTIPLDNPAGVSFTLGSSGINTMSSQTASESALFGKMLNDQPKASEVLEVAKEEMTAALNGRTTGYVNIVQENDISQALIISDTPDWTHATKMWKFDMNGLGYSNKRNSQGVPQYTLGITMNGEIVADFIKTGVLSDGVGVNQWNMGTGEFRLQSTSTILAGRTNTKAYLKTLDELATAIENTKSGLTTISKLQELPGNMLRLSSSFDLSSPGTWTFYKKRGVINTVIFDLDDTDTPNRQLKRAIQFSPSGLGDGKKHPMAAYIVQSSNSIQLPYALNKVYTVSCYVRLSVGSITDPFKFGIAVGNRIGRAKASSSMKTKLFSFEIGHIGNNWTRLSQTFILVRENDPIFKYGVDVYQSYVNGHTSHRQANYIRYTQLKAQAARETDLTLKKSILDAANRMYDKYLDASKRLQDAKAQLTKRKLAVAVPQSASGYVQIAFGAYSGSHGQMAAMAGPMLNEGNVASTWYPHPRDSDYYNVMQRKALDDSFTQAKILDRMTNGSNAIYMTENGRLYIKASAISSNLSSDIITDKKGNNYWDLAKGTLVTKNIELENSKSVGGYSIAVDYSKVTDSEFKFSSVGMDQGTVTFKNGYINRPRMLKDIARTLAYPSSTGGEVRTSKGVAKRLSKVNSNSSGLKYSVAMSGKIYGNDTEGLTIEAKQGLRILTGQRMVDTTKTPNDWSKQMAGKGSIFVARRTELYRNVMVKDKNTRKWKKMKVISNERHGIYAGYGVTGGFVLYGPYYGYTNKSYIGTWDASNSKRDKSKMKYGPLIAMTYVCGLLTGVWYNKEVYGSIGGLAAAERKPNTINSLEDWTRRSPISALKPAGAI